MISDFIYQIIAFGDFSNIESTPENMQFMLDAFKKYDMVPSVVLESVININNPNATVQRLAALSKDNQEQIIIYSNRINFVISSADDNELEITKLKDHNDKILDVYKMIFDKFNKSANRLCFNTSSLIAKVNQHEIDNILSKFSNPLEFYSGVVLEEWGTYFLTRKDVNICGKEEKLNIITKLSKTKTISQESNLTSDGFQIDIDINTIPERNNLRFDSCSFKVFIEFADKTKDKIFEDMRKLL
jgi:hypothetical protein